MIDQLAPVHRTVPSDEIAIMLADAIRSGGGDRVISGRRAMTRYRVHSPHTMAQSGAGSTTVRWPAGPRSQAPARAR